MRAVSTPVSPNFQSRVKVESRFQIVEFKFSSMGACLGGVPTVGVPEVADSAIVEEVI